MSLKDLFAVKSVLPPISNEQIEEDIESVAVLDSYNHNKNRIEFAVDYSTASNFSVYGSAQKYYSDSFARIYEQYPYDGSKKEKLDWENSSSLLDVWVLENVYPKTTGYAVFSPNGWSTRVGSQINGYGEPTTKEYIYIKGGPNTNDASTLVDKFKDSNNQNPKSNIYDLSNDRNSNLQLNLSGGVSLEFWLKKAAFNTTNTTKEVLFDLWNNVASSSTNYGRLTLELSGTNSGSPFYLTLLSGTTGFSSYNIGSSLTTASVANDSWNHYSLTIKNSGSAVEVKFYVNGELNSNNTTGTNINDISGALTANIGSLVTAASGTATAIGWGKLSGSLDEFRYWKTARTSKDIGRNWWLNVYGGANTDNSNTDLGVYYKFNEGITSTSSIDAIVLDYSGRISNGTWIGYSSSSRNTGSAINLYSGVELSSETPDPIIYSNHPDVVEALATYTTIGADYDTTNSNSIYYSFPDWIINEDQNGNLLNLTQIIASYLDTLYLQIKNFTNIKEHYSNIQVDEKPFPFAKNLLDSLGLITPNIFIDSSLFEQVMNRDEDRSYEDKLNDVRNIIYENIYSNLQSIYKSKGSEKSVRNLLRCYGIDEKIVKLNIYSNNDFKIIKDDLSNISTKKKAINFNDTDRFSSTIYQFSTSSYGASNSYISGASAYDYVPLTFEVDTVFPKKLKQNQNEFFPTLFLTSSIFGAHSAKSTNSDLTWETNDYFNFQVFAIRPEYESEHATFVLSSSNSVIPTLSSSLYFDVYNNEKWNFAVRLSPQATENANLVSGTISGSYNLEFYGVSTVGDSIIREFTTSASISYNNAINLTRANKRFYLGAERTNFTGSLIKETDIKILDFKIWSSYIDNDELKAHARDSDNYGVKNANKPYYLTNTNLNSKLIPKVDTLLLHWDFNQVTSSDNGSGILNASDGKFIVNDLTSGSLTYDKYSAAFNTLKKYDYIGRGDFFLQNDSTITDTQYLFTSRLNEFENIQNSNLVNILSEDEQNQTRTRETRPINYFFSFEKSMAQTISEEMLKMFSTILDFNNLVGEPVNKYRKNYKDLNHLRTLFFQNVQNEPDLDKYLDFYKWIDSALGKILLQLVPASADTSHGLLNVIENHALTRNKHQYKFPTLEFKPPILETGAIGINKHLYNWKYGHRPINNLEDENCFYWNARAERDIAPLSSSISSSNYTRNQVLSTTLQVLNRSFTTPFRYKVETSNEIKGGTNFNKNKNIEFLKIATAPHGPMDTDDVINIPANYLFIGVPNTSSVKTDCSDIYSPNTKVKYHFTSVHGRDYLSSSLSYGQILKSDIAVPANFVSGNVITGYNSEVASNFMSGVILTNIHNDAYGHSKEIPIQGPFTNQWVGGLQSRHISLNRGTDDYTSRPEAWKIVIGQLGTSSYEATIGFVGADYPYPEGNPTEPSYPVTIHKRATYYRDFIAKSPYNIKNIATTTSSYNIGNYDRKYQYLNTTGRTTNNKLLVDSTSSLTQTELFGILRSNIISGRVDFILPTRVRNETIIGNKFSSPGDYRTRSRGYSNLYAEEYSPYNAQPFKNRMIIGDNRRTNLTLTDDSVLYTPAIVSGTNKTLNALTAIPSTFGGYQSGSATISSFHKTSRNGGWELEYSGSTVVLKQQFDNGFYSYAIPKTDSQYSWINYSLSSSNDKTTIEHQGHLPETIASGSTSYEPTLSLITQSLVGTSGSSYLYGFEEQSASNFVPIGFSGLNNVIVDFVSDNETNMLGGFTITDYFTGISTVDAPRYPLVLNGILLNRNGPYGNPTFKQIRAKNKIIKNLDRNNTFSFIGNDGEIYNVQESSVYYNVPLILTIQNNNTLEKFELTTSYENIIQNFETPFIKNVFTSTTTNNVIYDNIFSLLSNNVNYTLLSISYEKSVYPKKRFSTLNAYKKKGEYEFSSWREKRSDRQEVSSSTNRVADPVTSYLIPTQSIWPLDARIDMSIPYLSNSGGGEGVLQNSYSTIHNGTTSSITASILYAYKHMLASNQSWTSPVVSTVGASTNSYLNTGNGLFDGTAKWQTDLDSNENQPYYDSYEEWYNQIKYKNKDYQVLPEYTITTNGTKLNNIIKANNLLFNDSLLNKIYVNGVSTTTQKLINVFLESNTLDNVDRLKQDVQSIVKKANITLTCDSIIKLNPKSSFYPANKTVEIANHFYDDVVNNIVFWSSSADPANYYNQYQIAARNFLTPLFAPGIMYNTIKSGIAVDFPILTSSINVTSSYITPVAVTSGAIDYMINNSKFDSRLPFETLYNPEVYLKGVDIIDMNPHPSASLNITGSWDGTYNSILYKSEIHNYLSEVVDFFLPESKLTSLISKPESEFKKVDPTKQYRALIKLYKPKAEPVNNTAKRAKLNRIKSGDPTTNYTRPQFQTNEKEKFTLYSRASAFGPPVAGGLSSSYTSDVIDSSNGYYSPFTPPYYDGESWVLLTYNPTGSVPYKPTLEDIINNLTASYLRYEFNSGTLATGSAPLAYGNLNLNSMQASASLNLFNIVNVDSTNIDNISNNSTVVEGTKVWAIQTKFETPILDFTSVDIDTIDSGSQVNRTIGMWHQKGEIIKTDTNGIMLQVTDIPKDYILYGGEFDERRTIPTGRNLQLTSSLADIVGFSKEPVRIGQISNQKIIKEAVVAIPYINSNQVRKYFKFDELSKEYVSFLRTAQSKISSFAKENEIPDSIKNQISLMKEYVLPPGLDFMKNDLIDPISMYIFEFSYILTQEDLANIWQGIMPSISINFAEQSKSITHELALNELLDYDNISDNLQWFVFKVKKKAKNNYNNKLLQSLKETDSRSKIKDIQSIGSKTKNFLSDINELDYSYNWPYDDFSLIEVAKIKAKIDLLSYEDQAKIESKQLNINNISDKTNIAISNKISTSEVNSKQIQNIKNSDTTVLTESQPVTVETLAIKTNAVDYRIQKNNK